MNKNKRARYTSDWEYISTRIKFKRAGNRCEKCQLKNGSFIRRKLNGQYEYLLATEIEYLHKIASVRKISILRVCKEKNITYVNLSVAHLNHDEKDNRDENLLCMCQRCHLMYDKQNNMVRASASNNGQFHSIQQKLKF